MRPKPTKPDNPRNDVTLVLDCNFLCHQARFALQELSWEGVHTGIIFGFLGRVLHLAQKFNTSDVHFCWDSRHSYRREQYPEYKANRIAKRIAESKEDKEARQASYSAFKMLRKEILPSIGMNQNHVQKGLEADDMIAIVVQGRVGLFIIVSSDEDLFQLLAANVKMYNPTKHELMTGSRLKTERYCTPENWAKLKCLTGCKTDNVKGIRGIGERYATKHLNHVLSFKTRASRLIKEGEKAAYAQNWSLVKLPHPRTREPKNLHAHNHFNEEAFVKWCKKFGMESFIKPEKLAEWRDAWK